MLFISLLLRALTLFMMACWWLSSKLRSRSISWWNHINSRRKGMHTSVLWIDLACVSFILTLRFKNLLDQSSLRLTMAWKDGLVMNFLAFILEIKFLIRDKSFWLWQAKLFDKTFSCFLNVGFVLETCIFELKQARTKIATYFLLLWFWIFVALNDVGVNLNHFNSIHSSCRSYLLYCLI